MERSPLPPCSSVGTPEMSSANLEQQTDQNPSNLNHPISPPRITNQPQSLVDEAVSENHELPPSPSTGMTHISSRPPPPPARTPQISSADPSQQPNRNASNFNLPRSESRMHRFQPEHGAAGAEDPEMGRRPIRQPMERACAKLLGPLIAPIVLTLIGTSNNSLVPLVFIHHPTLYLLFVIFILLFVYSVAIGLVLRDYFPLIARGLLLFAFICLLLVITITLHAFVPHYITWAPWLLFSLTFLSILVVLIYQRYWVA